MVVTGHRPGFTLEQRRTSVSSPVALSNFLHVRQPTIRGEATLGSQLEAIVSDWGMGATQFAFQWLADGQRIPRATQSSLILKSAELGKVISVVVTGSEDGFIVAESSSAPTGVVLQKMGNIGRLGITGALSVGQRLNLVVPRPGTPGVMATFVWRRDNFVIDGAAGSSYSLTSADLAHRISADVTFSKSGYLSVARSASVDGLVSLGHFSSRAVVRILGSASLNSTLRVVVSGLAPLPEQKRVLWYIGGILDERHTDTIKLGTNEAGKSIRAEISVTRAGFETSTYSTQTVNNWRTVTVKKSFDAWNVFANCLNYGDSLIPCHRDDYWGNGRGANIYSSGDGALMMVGSSFALPSATKKWRLTFVRTFKIPMLLFAYRYASSNPYDISALGPAVFWPVRGLARGGENLTTNWSYTTTGNRAYFVLQSMSRGILFMRSITLEYEKYL